MDTKPTDIADAAAAYVVYVEEQSVRRKRAAREQSRNNNSLYRMKMGRETIWLNTIEYRILRFLAARPYRAFSRRHIARSISTHRYPVVEDRVDRHIATLRRKLGFFANYVQRVPYIGYRFKE